VSIVRPCSTKKLLISESDIAYEQTRILDGNYLMHEMGIALEIIDIVNASIPADMAHPRVETVNVKIGKLSAVVPESLRFCFEIAIQESALSGAKLEIEEIPVIARCKDCSAEFHIDGPAFQCPQCKSGGIELMSGRELDIQSIEIIDEES
jgi:hydrogenase nickel incorporation protein HypA/HybF